VSRVLYHGGIKGKNVGDILVPAPPHQDDGCPICEARAKGRHFTVRQARAWALSMGEKGRPMLRALEGADPNSTIDPPTPEQSVYSTESFEYARWYAARSRGDLYRVEPIGDAVRSTEDPFPTWKSQTLKVVSVVERSVFLDRRDRRSIQRLWKKADKAKHRSSTGEAHAT
jgi:hypothetical protein